MAGLTRSPGKARQLRALGAEPVVCDVFDAGALAAASAGGADRVIAQSIAWELPNESGRAVTAEHERSVLGAGGVVIRYGQLYGPGTYYESGRFRVGYWLGMIRYLDPVACRE